MTRTSAPAVLPAGAAVRLFLAFAYAYFLSALLRGVTATLAPNFSADLGLAAGDLGLLGGAFFLGFALAQLPLGSALDRYGARRVILALLALAVAGCAAFAAAQSFAALTAARALIGVGVGACLMAPMTTFRHRFTPVAQLRANSWMLMTGSLGMVASTLPVRWLLPLAGWRGLFWIVAAALALAAFAIAASVPRDAPAHAAGGPRTGYGAVFAHRAFQRYAPLGFFQYGALIAVQSLWAGPWLVEISGQSPDAAARGLFFLNLCMLAAFLSWGAVVPKLYARGWTTARLVATTVPLSLAALVLALVLGPAAGAWNWALFCVACSATALAQPAVGQAFPGALAGRALSAYNLVVFAGVFSVQWGLGLAIDAFRAAGFDRVSAYRGAFALLGCCCALAYLWFLWRTESTPRAAPVSPGRTVDNPPPCPDS